MLGDDCLLATGAITPHKGLRSFHPTRQATSTSGCWTVVVVQSLSCVQLFVTPWAAAGQAYLSFTISWSLCKLISFESMMPSNYLILYHPLLPSIFSSTRSFPVSQLFPSGAQSIGASTSASVFPVNIQGWFPLGLTGLILLSMGLSKVFSSTTVWKHQFFSTQPSLWSNSHKG